jgi:hypothetical protein
MTNIQVTEIFFQSLWQLAMCWMMGWILSPGKAKNFLFPVSSTPVLGSIHPLFLWVPGALSG